MKKFMLNNCFYLELPDSYIVLPNLKSGYHTNDPNAKKILIIGPDKQAMFSVEGFTKLDGDLFQSTEGSPYRAENICKFLYRIKTLEELINDTKCEIGGIEKWHWCVKRLYEDNGKLKFTEYYLSHEGCSEMISILQADEEDVFSTLLPYIKCY